MKIHLQNIQLDHLRQDHRIPMLLGLVFILLLLIAISNSIMTFTADHTKAKQTLVQQTPNKPLPNIANLHLFGIYSTNLSNLPLTQLQLTLAGTVVSLSRPSESYALITSPGQPTKVYKTKAALPSGATIRRIEKNYIVLDDNGALEKLTLPIKTLSQ